MLIQWIHQNPQAGNVRKDYRFDIDTFCNASLKKLKVTMAAAANFDIYIAGIVS